MVRQITSLQHPLVKHLVKLRQNGDYRHEHQNVVIEGIKPVSELMGHAEIKTLILIDESLFPKGIDVENIVIVPENVMKKISGMQAPEGVVAEIAMPKTADLSKLNYLVAFEGVSDPGNLGTLLRTALALGWQGAFFLDHCCDPYNEKALQAARGATFRLPMAWGNWKKLNEIVKANNLVALGAELKGTNLEEIESTEKILLVLGNEAHGLSQEAKDNCQAVTIPMPGQMESLNVSIAGGIMMYVLRPRRILMRNP